MKAIEIISIPVTDQQRAKRFYQHLGFEVAIEAPYKDDQKWIQMGFPGGGIFISLVTWFDHMPAGCIDGLVIKTGNIEKDSTDLTAAGIEPGRIDDTPWGRFMTVTDPDGNQISLHQAK